MENLWLGRPGCYAIETPIQIWEKIGRFAFGSGSRTQWVFRGVKDAKHSVRSTLVRTLADVLGRLPTEEELVHSETEVLNQARSWGLGRKNGVLLDDLAVLSKLQHHGVPTRLLDVTGNPTTALFFATLPTPPDPSVPGWVEPDGVFFAFNVTGLPQYETHGGEPGAWDPKKPSRKRWQRALKKSAADEQPFLVVPVDPDDRMRAQEGKFLSSAAPLIDSKEPFDGIWAPNPFSTQMLALLEMMDGGEVIGEGLAGFGAIAIQVPGKHKAALRRILSGTFNRSNKTMFPDLMGLRDGLDKAWFASFPDLPPSEPDDGSDAWLPIPAGAYPATASDASSPTPSSSASASQRSDTAAPNPDQS